MTTHTHPETERRLKTLDDYLTQHVATRQQVEDLETKMTDEFKHLEGKVNDVLLDIQAVKDFLLPPKP